MPSSYLTELALRTAVNTTTKHLTTESTKTEEIRGAALSRVHELIQGSSTIANRAEQVSLHTNAIQLAVEGLEISYHALSQQLGILNNKRLSFDKERQSGVATFIIPTNKEESDLSKEEQVISAYIALSEHTSFSSYLGLHTAELSEQEHVNFYSVLPFYRMSEGLDHSVASTSPLEQQRTAINLFFTSALPEAISDIDTDFQTDHRFVAFWQSVYQGANYLNNRRAPRFIMMSLANLLWNLQHPVDPRTGFPLSMPHCIELCREVELFLNNLLNPDAPPYFQQITNEENELLSFARKIEVHVKALRCAYAEQQMQEINISDILNSTHHALRVIDKSIFKLIYKKQNPLTGKEEAYEKAAEELAYMVSYLNQLLMRNPNLMTAFQPFSHLIPESALMNNPPMTVLDALILSCHLSWRERDHLLKTIADAQMDSALEFSMILRKFDKTFVKPIKQVSKIEVGASVFHPKHREVGRLTAQRLIPLITLVVEDYRVKVDTHETYEAAKASKMGSATDVKLSGKEQVFAINKQAAAGTYYHWTLSPFISADEDTEGKLNLLPKQQYRMTQLTKLLDGVNEIVEHYRSFLQKPAFQLFLNKCLRKVKEEYDLLERRLQDAENHLAQDESISRNLQGILRQMTGDLNSSLETFRLASVNFEHVISEPDFADQQKQLLSVKLNRIHEQFTHLFSEDSGIAELISEEVSEGFSQATQPQSVPAVTVDAPEEADPGMAVETRQVIALRKLVQRCYEALSYQSRSGRKGALLADLLVQIDNKPHFNAQQVKHAIMEVARVTSSYRETWFFQASYGQTRSAKAFIAAIKDPEINRALPIQSILFDVDESLDLSKVNDEQIVSHLRALRSDNCWQTSSSEISAIAAV